MKLDLLQGVIPMTDSHHLPVLGAGGDLQLFRDRRLFQHQRVISCGSKRRFNSPINSSAVMSDLRGFAMHQYRGVNDPGSEHMADRLMAQADTEHRCAPA